MLTVPSRCGTARNQTVFPCLALGREGGGATRIACRGAPRLVATEAPKVQRRPVVEIRVGYELIYDCPQPTPMMLVLNIHYTRAADILVPDHLKTDPPVPIAAYRDSFGNWCSRIVAPKGRSGYRAPRSSRTRVSP